MVPSLRKVPQSLNQGLPWVCDLFGIDAARRANPWSTCLTNIHACVFQLKQVLEETSVSTGGVDYKYLTLKYNTVTRSGYDVERIAYIASTVRQQVLCSLIATVSSERRKKMESDLAAIRASFRVANSVDVDFNTWIQFQHCNTVLFFGLWGGEISTTWTLVWIHHTQTDVYYVPWYFPRGYLRVLTF